MNIVLPLSGYSPNQVFFHEQVKNTVLENGKFTRIIYSNQLFALNGIFLTFHLQVAHVEKLFNKFKCIIDLSDTKSQLIQQQIMKLEQELLSKCAALTGKHKLPIYRLTEQLCAGHIKVFNYNSGDFNNNDFVLKIYGIWENDYEYGLTYKINGP